MTEESFQRPKHPPCLIYAWELYMLEFDMFDLRMMHYFLGIEIVQSAIGIFLCLSKEICARNLRQVLDEEL